MAKNERTRLSSSDTKIRASWVNNATKSLQITGQNVLKSFAPNLYEVTTSATKTSRDIIKDIRQNKYSVNNIHRNLKNNKYIKYAQDGLKNALNQVRTGNFNDPDAADKAMMHSFGFDDLESMLDDDGGISFGDDGAENNVDVDINVSNSNAGMFALSEQLRSQTEVSLQTSQANLDAMIALNANSMMQTQKISTEIISGLNAINQNLASLVEYNNSSMSKFITSSIAYYEKMGSRAEEEGSYTDSSKVTVNDVLRGNNGNINFTAYKDYVKTNFKKTLKDTEIGQIASMVMNDQFIETMVANPVGTMVDMLSAYIVPTTVQNVIKGAEATFNSVVPKMLHQLSEWGETETGLKKYIGKTFGVTVKRQDTLDKSTKIEKGAVPFDGITRHTINEIITKELSEQTAYLKAIAQKIRVKDVDKVKNQAEVFDFQTGNYTTVAALQEQLRKDIQSNISWAFDNSDLGKEISSRFMKSDDTELTKKEKQRFLDFLHLLDERNSGKYIDLGSEAYTSLINQASSGTNTSTAIKEEFKRVIQDLVDDPDMKALKDSYHSLVYEASRARNERLKYYEENPYETHLYRTGNITSIDEFMGVKNGTASGVGHRNGTSATSNQNGVDTIFNHISQSIASTASGIVSGLAAGSLPQAFENIKSTFQSQVDKGFDYIKRKVLDPVSDKIRTSIFGIADENGVRTGGLFAGILNSFGDATKKLKWHITGQEYIDSNGVRHEAKSDNETIVGTFKSIGRTVKDSLTSKFSTLTDENTGIVPTIKSTIHEGLVGWQEAIFGKTLTEDERKDLTSSAVKSINERLPSSMVGAATGTFAGAGLLGSLIGGPVGGAILGTAVGFASKSEKFQKFIFGEVDDEGNRVHEGIISQKVQDYVKDNKKELIGSGVVGAAVGSITGAGLLGTLVGGPVAGAVLGIGTSVLKKSHMFNEFLFGDEARGQKGLIQSVKDIFGKYKKSSDGQKDLNKKVLGMGALGAGAGAVTAAAIGKMGVMGLALGPAGPIGGALLGLGASMLAQKDNFHKWLFGEKDENGEMKSAGLITQFGNMIKTSIFMPMKDSITNYLEDAAITIHYDILDNIRFGIQPILDKTMGLAKSIGDKVTNIFNTMATNIKEFFTPIVDVVDNFVVKPVRKLVSGVTNIVYKSVKFAVTMPFKIIGGIGTFLKNRVTDTIAAFKTAVLDNIITPVKNTVNDYIIKPIKDKVTSFFRKIFGGIRNVATNIAGAISYIGDKWYNVGKDPKKFKDHTGEKDPTYYQQKRAAKENRKVEEQNLAQRRRERKIRTKNSEIIRKATGGMYTEDTEENRQRARMNDKYKDYKFDEIEALDVKWKREKQERDTRSTAGLSENGILNANLSQLDPESQQVSLLSRILNVIKGKGDSQGYNHDDENQNSNDQQTNNNHQDSQNNTNNTQTEQQNSNDQNNNSEEQKSDFRKEIEHRQAEINAAGGLFKFWENSYKNTNLHRFAENIESDLRNKISWYGNLFNRQNNSGGRGFVKGTNNATPGPALVGEGGNAELVEFLGGEKVYPSTHPKTQAYMSTVANATGTMGLNENNIVNSDIKKLDTQSQQVQILLRILAILKGKPSTIDAKDIKKFINSEHNNLPSTSNTDKSTPDIPEHEKTRAEIFQEDIDNVVDRIKAAGGLRGYARNAIRGSISRSWNRSLLKRGIDTATNVTRGISNAVRGTATRTLGLGKYLLNRGISAGRNAKSLISGIFGNKEFSAQDDLDENENTNIEDSDDKQSNALALISERRDEQKAEIESDRKARMAEAIDKGLTAEERQAQIKEEKERSVLDVLKESSQAQVTEQRGFTKLWSSIFSKKGLITGSILLAAPFVIKLIRKIKNGGLWSLISSGLSSVGKFFTEKVGPFFKEHIEPVLLSGLETIGETISSTLSGLLPEWLSGIFGGNSGDTVNPVASALGYKTGSGRMQWGVLDEKGEWDNESGSRLKLGTKVGVKAATVAPGVTKTFTENVSKNGLKKGTTKTLKALSTKKGRKGISKVGSDELIKSGNKKFRTNIRNIFHGAANTADDVGGQVFDVIPVESVGSRIVSNTADDVAEIGAKPILALPSGATSDIVKGSKSLIGSTRNVGAAVADDVFVDVAGETFKDLSDDVGEAVVKKARKTVVGETIEKAGGVLKDKVVKIVSKFADKLVELVEKKIGTKLANTGIGKIVAKVTQCLSNHFSKISAKVSAIFGAEAGLATTGIGLLAKDSVFCTLTAINGVSGTARLFQVDQENVDWVMKTISGALGFFNGTLVGSICDVVNELIVSVMGIDFYTSIASIVYKAIMAITGNKNKAEALNLAQGEFKDKYEAYVNDESQTSLDNAKRLGLVDSNMTLEEYKATYTKTGSDYKSFADYNDEQHQTIGSRMFGGLSKVGNAIVSPFVNKKTTIVTDTNGNTYVKNKDGTYTAKDSSGKEIGVVSGTLVENLENTTSETKVQNGLFGKLANTKAFRDIGNFNVNVGKGIGHFFAGSNSDAFQASDGTYYTTDGKHYNRLGYALGDDISPDQLQEMVNSGLVSGPTKFKIASGYMNMGVSIGRGISNIGTGIANTASNVWSGIKKGVPTLKDKAYYYSNPLNVLADIIRGGRSLIEKITDGFNTIKDKAIEIRDKAVYFVTKSVPNFFKGLKKKYTSFFKEIVPEFFTNVKDRVTGFFTESVPNFFKGFKKIYTSFFKEIVPEFFTNVKDKLVSIKDGILQKITDLGNGIKNGIIELKDKIKNKISGAFDGVKTWWNSGKTNLTNALAGNGVGLRGGKGPELAYATAGPSFNSGSTKNITFAVGNIGSNNFINKSSSTNKNKVNIRGYIASDNSYYDADGVHYNAHGDKIGSDLSKEELEAQFTSGILKESELPFAKSNDDYDIENGSATILKKFNSVFTSVQNKASHIFTFMENGLDETFDNIVSSVDVNDWKPVSGKAYYDPQGNYYILTAGNKFNYCNTLGDVIGTATKADVYNKLKASILKEYSKPNITNSIANDIKSMRSAVTKAWSAAKNSGTSKWSAITKLLKGGRGSGSAISKGNSLSGYTFVNKDAGDTGVYDALSSFREYATTYRKTLNEGNYSSVPIRNSNSLKSHKTKTTKVSTNSNNKNTTNNTRNTISNISTTNNKKPRLFTRIKNIVKNIFGGSGGGYLLGGSGYTYTTKKEKIPFKYCGSDHVYKDIAVMPSNMFMDSSGINYPSNIKKTATDKIDELQRKYNSIVRNGYKQSDIDEFNKLAKKYEKWEKSTLDSIYIPSSSYQGKKSPTQTYSETVKKGNTAVYKLIANPFEKGTDGYEKYEEYRSNYSSAKDTSEKNKWAKKIQDLSKDGKHKDDLKETDDTDSSSDATLDISSSSSSKKSSSSSSGVSGSIFDVLGSFFGEFASRAGEGLLTGEFNKDWSSFWGINRGSSNSDDGDSSDSSSSDGSSINIDGVDDLKIVQKFTTGNGLYNANDTIDVKGLVLHSVGGPLPDADNWRDSFNSISRASVHAFIDGKKDNYVVQTAPWNLHCYHVGGSANDTHIGIEMGESDKLTNYSGASFTVTSENKSEVLADVKRAYSTAVKLFAVLCREFDLDPLGTNVIVSHNEARLRGIGTDHVDPEHYWDGTNSGLTMDKFRADVNKLLKKIKKSDSSNKKDSGGDGRGRHSILNKQNLLKILGGFGASSTMGDVDDVIQDMIAKANKTYEEHTAEINNNIVKNGPSLIKKYKLQAKLKNNKGGRGVPYYSQTDKRWANNAYGNDGATMGDTGCGPTVMAMITSKLTGKNIKPTDMASLATRTGMRDETGTNSNFINTAANSYRLKSNRSNYMSSSSIYESAKNGPTVLLGQNKHGTSNPFTDAGHYVVTDGVDSNGNINVKDPRGSSYNRKYKANDLANTTSSMWNFGGSGVGRKLLSRISYGIGGFGRKLRRKARGGSGLPYYAQTDKKWADNSYGNDGATMGDTGCGPTVMAMITSGLTGEEVDPTEMASLANATGMRDETGTNAGFIDVAANSYGLSSRESIIPNSVDIYESAKNGPTVLLGQNESGTSNPFTDAGHYVVTDGVDSNGMVNIKDPRGRRYNKKYNVNDLANTTSSMWDFGGNGKKKNKNTNLSRTKIASNRLKRKSKGGSGKKSNMNTWMSIVRTLHKLISESGATYGCTKDYTIGKKTVTVRVDCSGWVFGCLNFYDVYEGMGSTVTLGSLDSFEKATGFKHKEFTGWSDCQMGDIVGNYGHHAEIFSHIDSNGTAYVYNCGCNEAIAAPGATASYSDATAKGMYTYCWSPGEPGANAVTGTESGTWDGDDSDTSSSSSSTSSSDSTSSFKNKTLGKITSWLSEFANRSIEGIIGGHFDNDWDSFWDNLGNDTSDSDSNDDSATLTGSDNASKIWNFFKKKGMSDIAIAGIMGNMNQESGLDPANNSDAFTSMSDEAYTKALDDGSRTREQFVADGSNGHGYGLVQWTWPDTKGLLYDYAKKKGKSVGDLQTQLEFLYDQMTEGSMKTQLYDRINKAKTVEEAAQIFEEEYERAGVPAMENRISYAQKYYDTYGGSGNGRFSVNKGGYGVKHRPSNINDKMLHIGEDPRGTGFNGGNEKTTVADIKKYEKQRLSIPSGGYGDAIVDRDNIDILKRPKPPQMNKFSDNNKNNSDMSKVMNTIVDLLESIAGNTNSTSEKLDYLRSTVRDVKFVGGNTTNNVVNNGSSVGAITSGGSGVGVKNRNRILAEKIARGI